MSDRTYGQYCGLAKALDHVGDRWTLLIIRELLVSPRRYSRIREALPGIASNLLSQRLQDLRADGLIAKDEDSVYSLTPFGRELEDAVFALVRWGGRWMTERAATDRFRPEWLAVALRSLVPLPTDGSIEIRVPGQTLVMDRTGVRLSADFPGDAVMEGEPEQILGVAAGKLPLSQLRIKGDKKLIRSVFRR